jgi:hypothetical protein
MTAIEKLSFGEGLPLVMFVGATSSSISKWIDSIASTLNGRK